eukprot:CAMPEP_0167740268 /NCGR_PEP_ID=MMETSP0110_2-20121227/180_1 /TAXON_ID=629695 /ORGANISM="Gymnochlora sp., Strain CCMP2014" /LENGTH=450 /DNA_ID=CAMNT_0007624137 /DNA_START=18 /DNA_END=1370 /DNA_ORIENTATION=-
MTSTGADNKISRHMSSTFRLDSIIKADPLGRTMSQQASLAVVRNAEINRSLSGDVETVALTPPRDEENKSRTVSFQHFDSESKDILVTKTEREKSMTTNTVAPASPTLLPAGSTRRGLPVRTKSECHFSPGPIRNRLAETPIPEPVALEKYPQVIDATQCVMNVCGFRKPSLDMTLRITEWLRKDTVKLRNALLQYTSSDEKVQIRMRWMVPEDLPVSPNRILDVQIQSENNHYLERLDALCPRFARYYRDLEARQRYLSSESKPGMYKGSPPPVHPYKVIIPGVAVFGSKAQVRAMKLQESYLHGNDRTEFLRSRETSYLRPSKAHFQEWLFKDLDSVMPQLNRNEHLVHLVRILGLHARERVKLLVSLGLVLASKGSCIKLSKSTDIKEEPQDSKDDRQDKNELIKCRSMSLAAYAEPDNPSHFGLEHLRKAIYLMNDAPTDSMYREI